MSPKVAVAAVETTIFPLYEVVNGLDFTITHIPRGLPVETYLSLQGRYKHLGPAEVRTIQAEADRAWASLQRRARENSAHPVSCSQEGA
jgi:pyruvate ferredoxin oxidoreductase beta subunit